MKILMISSFVPFPLYSGGHVRLYNLIKNLSDTHDITLICEKRDYQTKEDVGEVEKICKKVVTVKRAKQWSIKNILNTGFSDNPFLVVGHTSDDFKLAIRDELVREKYDLIHAETFYVLQNLPKVSVPIVLVEHNIEYLVYKRFAELASPIFKPFYLADIAKLKRKEHEAWAKADKLVVVSKAEKKIMKRTDVDIVPNGVDIQSFVFRSFQNIPEEKRVLFIGDFKWLQNRDALEFILKDIWPKTIAIFKSQDLNLNLKLWIVGKNIPESLKILAKSYTNVILDEHNKQETSQIFRRAYMLLAPLRAAGGTSYKVLEAMSSGTVVVTTNLGIEGLEAKNNVHVLTADDGNEIAEQVLNLFKDHSLYRKLTLNARKLIEEKYDWKIISEKLNQVYMSCL